MQTGNEEITVLKYVLRLFGSGRLPPEGHRVIEAENCRFLAQCMIGSLVIRDAHGPGQHESARRHWFLGSLAISDKRLLAYRYGSCLLNVAFDDHRLRSIDFSAETPGVLSIRHDLSLFHPASSGDVEICFRTGEALRVCTTMASHVRTVKARPSTRGPSR
jgi:hypothetical protein